MKTKTLSVGHLFVNCYIVYDEVTGEAVIIDPGDEPNRISKFIEENNLKPVALMLTHSHYDHVCAVDPLRDKYGIKLAIHEDEKRLLENGDKNISIPFFSAPICITPDILLKDGEKYAPFSNGVGFNVIHTPGHTEGGASYYMEELNAVYTGDTLFQMSIGRTDLLTGNYEQIISSITEKLLPLGDDVIVYPGHGEATTIKDEKTYNRFLTLR